MEEQALAALGRKQLELDQLNTNYNHLLVLVQWLATGEVSPERVHVDLATRTWKLDPLDEGNGEYVAANRIADLDA